MRRKMKWTQAVQTIRGKLMTAVIVCILIPAVSTLFIYNSLTEEAVKEQAISNSASEMKLVSGAVNNLLQEMLNIANHIQVNPDMNSYFKQFSGGSSSKEADAYLKFTATSRILQQLDSLTAVSEQSYISVILTDGTVFTNYSTDEFDPRAFEQEAWFQQLKSLNGFQTYWVGTTPTTFPYEQKDSPYQISMARTLRLDNSDIYGYVVVTMMESKFRQIFKDLAGERQVMLADEAGTVLSGPEVASIHTQFGEGRPKLTDPKQPGSILVKKAGSRLLVTEAELPANGWRLISVQTYKSSIVNISTIFNRVFLFQLISFTVVLLVLLAMIRKLTYPLVRLGKVASTVQRGNLDVRTGIRGPDEIGRLGFLFDQMLDRVRSMIEEISVTQMRKRKAELAMLQAQIHPHFLFNVLNSIRMKVMRHGDQESAKMIGSLSKLLRMTITREEDEITLHEEIELLTHYVELMNLRQKEEAVLQLDIEPEAFFIRVPRFILQPLVENALIHGLSQKAGTIRVTAGCRDSTLYLDVTDNGKGMESNVLRSLQEKLVKALDVPAGASEGERTGIGVLNVAERLRIRFGEQFRVDIESETQEGRGTTIKLSIPVYNEQSAEGEVQLPQSSVVNFK